jgi:hypothetical protein
MAVYNFATDKSGRMRNVQEKYLKDLAAFITRMAEGFETVPDWLARF